MHQKMICCLGGRKEGSKHVAGGIMMARRRQLLIPSREDREETFADARRSPLHANEQLGEPGQSMYTELHRMLLQVTCKTF